MAEELFYQDAVLYCYNTIQENLKYDDTIASLVSNFVITVQEKQDIDELRLGSISRCGKLLDIIFSKKRNTKAFVDVLKERQPELANVIEEERKSILSGLKTAHIQVLQQQVKNKYIEDKCNIIEKLPGESFTLDLSDETMLMPLDFCTHVVDRSFLMKQKGKIDSKKYQYKYHEKELECVEAIFCNLPDENTDETGKSDNEEPLVRLVYCTGIAGMGKTVTLNRLAWQWCRNINPFLKKFELLFLIPLGNVLKHSPILDILSDGAKGLNYIESSQKNSLHEYMKQHGDKVLIALDGGDEIELSEDSELSRLISGEIYSKVKVLFVSRPDISNVKQKTLLKADAKVHINGTNKEGMIKHIEASIIKTGVVGKDECKHILDQCIKFMSDINILYVPLYLSLFTVLFDQHWVKYASFTKFKVPKTMTQLFNSFMCIIIKLWLKRLKRKQETHNCSFNQSPFEHSSGVPIDISAKLMNIGRMSFDLLMKKQYQFSKEDFRKYLIDIKDIEACGMFSMVRHKKWKKSDKGVPQEQSFTFRHHTFQEYLAALYISYMQFKDSVFRDHITFSARQDTKPCEQTLEEYFMPIQQAMKFVYGLSPEFGKQILERCYSSIKIARNEKNNWPGVDIIDLTYEAELVMESGNCPQLCEFMDQHLLNLKTVPRSHDLSKYVYCYDSLKSMITGLSEKCCQNMLQSFYNISVKPIDPNGTAWEIYAINESPVKSDKLIIPNLDVTCYGLLSKFKLEHPGHIVIHKSMILDSKKIRDIFPKAVKLEIEGQPLVDVHNEEDNDEDLFAESCTLESVTLKSKANCSPLPASSVCNLLQEKSLKYLTVHCVDIFSSVQDLQNYFPKWNNLVELSLVKLNICESYEYIKRILKTTTKIQKLHLHNSYGDTCNREQAVELLNIISRLPNVMDLGFVHVFDQEGINKLCEYITKATVLQGLCLGEWDVMDVQGTLVKVASERQCLKRLEIVLWHCTQESFNQLYDDMTTINVAVKYTNAKVL